jgi:hypothetical protein
MMPGGVTVAMIANRRMSLTLIAEERRDQRRFCRSPRWPPLLKADIIQKGNITKASYGLCASLTGMSPLSNFPQGPKISDEGFVTLSFLRAGGLGTREFLSEALRQGPRYLLLWLNALPPLPFRSLSGTDRIGRRQLRECEG